MSRRTTYIAISAALVVLASPYVAYSQTLGAATTPPKRAHHALVYDEIHNRIILAGGSTPRDGGERFQFFNDVWALNGDRWQPLGTSGIERSGQKLAWDYAGRRVVSFGGFFDRSLPDLLELEDDAWRTLGAPPDRPVAEGGFVYDSLRNRFIAYGGSNGRAHSYGDTWEWNGREWKLLTAEGPAPRQAFAMVYDVRRDRVVLFGGMSPTGTAFGDTWEFDGRVWKQVATTGPSPRLAPGAAYDATRGEMILFGGQTAGAPSAETWSWNGREWKLRASDGPPARSMGYMAYDRMRNRTVLFGGRTSYPDGDMSDTWVWNGNTWRELGR